MPDFIMLMRGNESQGDWDQYIQQMIDAGGFQGGSSLGNSISAMKENADQSSDVTGFMRFSAENLDDAKSRLHGNPCYEGGGRVDILEIIPD